MLAVLSGQRSKEKEAPSKVRIRQIELKGSVCYQASSTVGSKVLHSNYSREEVIAYVEQSLQEGGFSQLQVQGRCKDGSVLIRSTVRIHGICVVCTGAWKSPDTKAPGSVHPEIHQESPALPFLRLPENVSACKADAS